jgi:hypothetical protein
MWSSGSFKNQWNPNDIVDDMQWEQVTLAHLSTIGNIRLPTHDPVQHRNLRDSGYIPFGEGVYFNAAALIASNISLNDFLALPFDRICQYFKINQQYEQLLQWAKSQKDRYLDEVIEDPTDKANISRLFDEIRQPVQSRNLNSESVRSFVRNRNRALAWRYVEDEEIHNLVDDPNIVKLLQFFRNMMQVMEEDQRQQHSAATYTASSISTSRYTVSGRRDRIDSAALNCVAITAKFNEPYKWLRQFNKLYPNIKSPEAECTICCETSIPFILMRKHLDKNNINDLLDNSLTYFYPEIVCGKCADYLCSRGIDPVRVPCYAAIPIINIVDEYKMSYHNCFAALTNYIIVNSPQPTSFISSISRFVLPHRDSANTQNMDGLKAMITVFASILKRHFDNTNMKDIFENYETQARN